MNYKRAGELSTWMFVFSIVAIGGTFFFKNTIQIVLFLLGIVLIIAGIVIRLIFWRCPKCKKMLHLGFRMEPTKCPYCKADLNVSGDVAEPTGKKK